MVRLVLKAPCVEQNRGEMVLLNGTLVTWSGCRNMTRSGCFGIYRELSGLSRTQGFDGPVARSGCCLSAFLVIVEIQRPRLNGGTCGGFL